MRGPLILIFMLFSEALLLYILAKRYTLELQYVLLHFDQYRDPTCRNVEYNISYYSNNVIGVLTTFQNASYRAPESVGGWCPALLFGQTVGTLLNPNTI